jgi:serine/threonine-protein kinase RsbW
MTSTHRLTRAAYPESVRDFREFIRERCVNVPGVNNEILYALQLAVDEACTNIITHGYEGLNPGSIILDLELDPAKVTISLTDFGHSFEPSNAPVPDIHAPLEERELGGYGLFLIRQSMDEMEYQVTEDGNKMILTRYLNKPVAGEH